MTLRVEGPVFAGPELDGLSRREYFAAHAPPLPEEIRKAYWQSLTVNEPDAVKLPWNSYIMERLAAQERRWRYLYADEMIKRSGTETI